MILQGLGGGVHERERKRTHQTCSKLENITNLCPPLLINEKTLKKKKKKKLEVLGLWRIIGAMKVAMEHGHLT
jgi:hypothetical protein